MPVTLFTPATVHDFAAPCGKKGVRAPAPKKGRRPKPKPEPKPKEPRGGILTPQVVSLLDDRLEEAIEGGVIELVEDDGPFQGFAWTLAELAALKRLLLREAYTEPARGPAQATATAPQSDARIEVYAARHAAGESLWCPADATAHKAHDRGLAIEQRRNGTGTKVTGWQAE